MTDSTETHDIAQRIADSVRDQLGDDGFSRRGFLGRSALAGGALLAIGSGSGMAAAQEDEEMPEETAAAFDDVSGTDIDVLNYALSLENLEDAFYQEGMETFDAEEFNNADAVSEFSYPGDQTPYELVETIGEHESTHVDVLKQSVTLLGGEPSPAGSYDFGFGNVREFLELGQVFENTGVAAYAGAAPYVESPDLLGVALSIHSVEARHAALLNGLNGDPFFPDAFDSALSQDEVLEAVSGFIADSEMEDDGSEMTDHNETATSDDE